MKRPVWLIAGTLVMSLTIWTDAQEQADPPEQAVKPKHRDAKADAMARLGLALQLTAYGEREKDPLALLTAARLLKRTPTQDAPLEKETGPEKEAGADTGASGRDRPKAATPLSLEQLLQLARELAGENEALLALARAIEAEQPRGPTTGPDRHSDCVRARSADIYRVEFRGAEIGCVAVRGDGSSDLDLYVYDPGGNLVQSDTSEGDTCYVENVPRRTGKFRIEVHNLGQTTDCYTIYTN
jgi:hypothetical protein